MVLAGRMTAFMEVAAYQSFFEDSSWADRIKYVILPEILKKMVMNAKGSPIEGKERHLILDFLRGFALLGICLANYPEFALYSFLDSSAAEAMPTVAIDHIVKWGLYIFVDGKFYTIFSLLFGIGFSIILENNRRRGANGLTVFYRRMVILFIIGLSHLLLIWSGDILMLYALVGMTLPLFLRLKDGPLLIWSFSFLALPVVIDTVCEMAHISLSSHLVEWQWLLCDRFGITEANFAYWLHDAHSYSDMWKFLLMGAVERMQEFVDGNRYFKVLGLFLIGYYIGRKRLYANFGQYLKVLKRICIAGLCLGLPLSALYAWSALSGRPFGLGVHSLFYFVSVYLTSFGYVAGICILYLGSRRKSGLWKALSLPGRMALTNYIGQSAIGVLLFYGVGFGLGAYMGLVYVELIAFAVFVLEVAISIFWLSEFRFGPLEWVWRCLTYGRLFSLR